MHITREEAMLIMELIAFAGFETDEDMALYERIAAHFPEKQANEVTGEGMNW